MATQTTNYNLVKPALTDSPPDITVMNPNWDKIDSELKINSSAIGQKADTASVNAALALKANTNEVLLLSGGNIVGNLNIGDTANSALRILKADDGLYSISAWKKNNPANDFLELRLDGSISGDWSFKNAFCVRNAGNGALYKVYHEGNVTVSTAAPSSALTNGCIHHVY